MCVRWENDEVATTACRAQDWAPCAIMQCLLPSLTTGGATITAAECSSVSGGSCGGCIVSFRI